MPQIMLMILKQIYSNDKYNDLNLNHNTDDELVKNDNNIFTNNDITNTNLSQDNENDNQQENNDVLLNNSNTNENVNTEYNNLSTENNTNNGQQEDDNNKNIEENINIKTENNENLNDDNVRYIVDDNVGLEAEKKLEEMLNKFTNNNLNIITDDNENINEYNTNQNTNITLNNTDNRINNNLALDNNTNNATVNLQELLELKIQEYKKKYPECIENLIQILGEKKYNKLSNDIKYLLIRFLAQDADIYFLDKYNSCSNEDKFKIISDIISDYKRHIHYDNVNLDELDYYYITPFILFLNRESENNGKRRRYLSEMKEMINNRIEKKDIESEIESGSFNDLDRIKRRVAWYKKTYPDIFKNFERSFTEDKFKIMSLGQKCILLRILTEGAIKNYYQQLPNEYEKQKFILEISKLYTIESKENNFSYDWFFSGSSKFEDYLQMRESLIEYEKSYATAVDKIKKVVGESKYQDMPVAQRYAILKYFTEPIIQDTMQVINNDENESSFINNLCDNFAYIFDKNISIRTFNALYNKMQKDLYNDYQQSLQQQVSQQQLQQAQLQQQMQQQAMMQKQMQMQQAQMRQQTLQQQNIPQTQSPQSDSKPMTSHYSKRSCNNKCNNKL